MAFPISLSVDLISFINVTLQDGKIHLNENEEGENRELSIDAVLQLEIKLYKENKTEILMDIYSPTKNVQTKLKDVCYKIACEECIQNKNSKEN